MQSVSAPPRSQRPGRALPILFFLGTAGVLGAALWFKFGPGAGKLPTFGGPAAPAATTAEKPADEKPAETPPAPVRPTPPPLVRAEAPKALVASPSTEVWRPYGPAYIDKRLGHSCPGFGVFLSVDSHPQNADIVLIGGETTGIWKTADAGKTWKFVSRDLPFDRVYSLKFAPSDPRAVWAFTNKGVVISADAGDTWKFTTLSKPDDLEGRMHGLVAVSPKNPALALAYADKKLHRTTDGGKTWTLVIDNILVRDLEFHPKDESTAYVAGGEGGRGDRNSLLVSSDAGKTFKAMGKPMEFKGVHRASLAVSPAKPDSVWMMVFGDRTVKTPEGEKNAMFGGLYRSDTRGRIISAVKQSQVFKEQPDGMLAWASAWPIEADKKAYDHKKDTSFMRMSLAQIGWDHALTVSDTDPNLIVAGGIGPVFSRDGGKTWAFKPEGEEIHSDIQDAVLRGNRLWVVNDGGLNRVELGGGKMVAYQVDGYRGQQLWGFGTSFKSGVAAFGVNHSTIKVFDAKTYDGFYSAGGADAQTAFVNLFDDKWVYGTPWWNEVIRRPLKPDRSEKAPWRRSAVDFGYIPYRTPEPHPNLIYSFFALHKEHDGKKDKLCIASHVARTDDNFHTFTTVWKRTGGPDRRLRVCFSNPDVMVVISNNDNRAATRCDDGNKVERTDDGGKTWTDITPKTLKGRYTDVAISDANPDDLWLAQSGYRTDNKVLRSRDGGKTWTDFSQGLDNSETRVMALQRGTRGGVYLAGRPGVWFRNDDMDAWVRYDSGLPFTNVQFLQIDYAAGMLRAGTNQGAWEAPLAQDFAPRAGIAASHNRVTPATATVKFFCHSALPATGAKWEWSFPGGTPASSAEENPVVAYDPTKPGAHDVRLRVTDARGRTDEFRLEKFITVGAADTELGKLKDVLLAVADPNARYGVENSKYLCRKLPEQSELEFEAAEAARSAAKHRLRTELYEAEAEAGGDRLRFDRPEPVAP